MSPDPFIYPERSIMPEEVLPNSISSELAKNRKIKHAATSRWGRCAATYQNFSGSAIRRCPFYVFIPLLTSSIQL